MRFSSQIEVLQYFLQQLQHAQSTSVFETNSQIKLIMTTAYSKGSKEEDREEP